MMTFVSGLVCVVAAVSPCIIVLYSIIPINSRTRRRLRIGVNGIGPP